MKHLLYSITLALVVLATTSCGGGGSKNAAGEASAPSSSSPITNSSAPATSSPAQATSSSTLATSSSTTTTSDSSTPISSANSSAVSSPAAIQLTKITGDNQIAVKGTAVATAPQVLLKDSNGNPQVGVQVNFAVTDDNNLVINTPIATNSSGYASWTGWTLSSARRVNTLTVTAPGLTPVTFSATGFSLSSNIQITRLAPLSQLVNEPNASVSIKIVTTFQIASVSVSFDSSSVAMQYNANSDTWSGNFALANPSHRNVTYVFTATDVNGNVTESVNTLTFDRPPVMTISTLPKGFVANPNMTFNITCSDDDPAGCASVSVAKGYRTGNLITVASGKESISQTVDFSSLQGFNVALLFTSVDSAGQSVQLDKGMYVEANPKLSVWAEVDGNIWDAADTRVLFLDETGSVPSLKIYDKSTQSTQILESNANLSSHKCTNYEGRLTPTGAIYKVCNDDKLYEYRNGSLNPLATVSSYLLNIAGNWALYDAIGNELWRMDLITGTSTLMTTTAQRSSFASSRVDANGDVTYDSSHNIYRIHNGVDQALTSDASATLFNILPAISGTNTIYLKANTSSTPYTYQLVSNNGTVESLISANADTNYAVGGDYIGYNSNAQIWRHTPAAGEQQVTFFGNLFPVKVDTVAPDGSMVINYGKRYLATPGAALQEIASSSSGRVIVLNGKFYILLGQTVFEVMP